MKKISKNLLDKCIGLSRLYWKSGDKELLDKRMNVAVKIANETKVDEIAVLDLIDSIVKYAGFQPNAENEVIYRVLCVLGWGVVGDVEEYFAG